MPCCGDVTSARLTDIHGLLHVNGCSQWRRNLWQDRLKTLLYRLFPVNLCAAIAAEEAAGYERGAARVA